jgi:hypothetical protein
LLTAILFALNDQPHCALRVQKVRNLLAKVLVALWRLVDAKQCVTARGVGENVGELLLKYLLNIGQTPRVTPTHEDHIRVVAECTAQVVHEFDDAGAVLKFLAEG